MGVALGSELDYILTKVCMDSISSFSFPNEPLISWVEHNVEYFLTIFVITFGWVWCCFAVAPTQKWWQKWSRNVQLNRGSFGKEILLIEFNQFAKFNEKDELLPILLRILTGRNEFKKILFGWTM